MTSANNIEMSTVIWHLNARLQPIERIECYEDGLDEVLVENNVGEVVGGGSLMSEDGEVESCDIEISINSNKIDNLIRFIKSVKMPKGSYLEIGEDKVEVGQLEGLAIYLNGQDLPNEIYQSCDINYVIEKLEELLGDTQDIYSYWEGSAETALYFYGVDFNDMKTRISDFVSSYPLCEKCRIIQIA